MTDQLIDALQLKHSPLAILLSDELPADATQLKEGRWGCVAGMLLAAARGKTVAFDRGTYGCPGGGMGLGYAGAYEGFPIECLLSTGGQVETAEGRTYDLGEGERFLASPELARRWAESLPVVDTTGYVVAKPLAALTPGEVPTLVWLLVNPDQLSALVYLCSFQRGTIENVTAPWGAACQSILFALDEARRDPPRGVIGFFDISQRHRIDRELLSFTVPYQLFQELESSVARSFLGMPPWQKLRERA